MNTLTVLICEEWFDTAPDNAKAYLTECWDVVCDCGYLRLFHDRDPHMEACPQCGTQLVETVRRDRHGFVETVSKVDYKLENQA